MFDQKRAERVGIKKKKQRIFSKLEKKQMRFDLFHEDEEDNDLETIERDIKDECKSI